MNVAIVGAGGSCGRQLAAQLLEQRILPTSSRLQLVGHQGGRSEHELWGLRADLEDAFVDHAPAIEVVLKPSAIDADLVVMLAGATISTDPNAPSDRAALGHTNHQIFVEYADALAGFSGSAPTVIVQSNPVELGVHVFSERLGRHRVLGAGAWSDTLRLKAEIAAELGVSRSQVHAWMLGQHGDYATPLWSQLQVRGIATADVEAMVARTLTGRTLADFPQEVRTAKSQMLKLVQNGQVEEAYILIQSLSPDLRAAVKPFFTHFTAGRTTEMATAHAVVEIVAALEKGDQRVLPAQVELDGEWLGLHGVIAAPVILGVDGWDRVCPLQPNPAEVAALTVAIDSITAANAAIT